MTQTVLVIDDSPQIHKLVTVRLRPEGVILLQALDEVEGLALARQRLPDLVLLDLDLAGTSGMDVCRALKADAMTAGIPVIFLTGIADSAIKAEAFDIGAVDYVTKPFDGIELRARVRAALRTKRYHDLLITRAELDGLTGLWNRAHFDARLSGEVLAAERDGRNVTLLMLDIDHFKQINDTHGHPFGDVALRWVAERIEASIRPTDVLCRYGGEEFGLILCDTSVEEGLVVAERIRHRVATFPVVQHAREVKVTVSIGVAAHDGRRGTMLSRQMLVELADQALYEAKRAGRDRVRLCSGEVDVAAGSIT